MLRIFTSTSKLKTCLQKDFSMFLSSKTYSCDFLEDYKLYSVKVNKE